MDYCIKKAVATIKRGNATDEKSEDHSDEKDSDGDNVRDHDAEKEDPENEKEDSEHDTRNEYGANDVECDKSGNRTREETMKKIKPLT